MKDYEVSHSSISLELKSSFESNSFLEFPKCKCLMTIQPFSQLQSIDLLFGSSAIIASEDYLELDQKKIPTEDYLELDQKKIPTEDYLIPTGGGRVSTEGTEPKVSHSNGNIDYERLHIPHENTGGIDPKKVERVVRVELIENISSNNHGGLVINSTHSAPNHQAVKLIDNWTLNKNSLHIPLPALQSTSKQFQICIWYHLNPISTSTLLKKSPDSYSTPTVVLDQHNMLNWFPCIVEDKYSMDWYISVPSHCPITSGKLLVVCAGDLVGRFSHPTSQGMIMYKYSSKIPISPKSVVIVVGAFESVKLNARSLGHGADLFAANDEVPDMANAQVLHDTSRIKVFYQKEWEKDLVYSTCQYLPQALEFVEQWVGASYPFSSLKIVFSGTSSVPVISGATLVVVNIQLLVSQRDLDHVWFSRFYLCAAIAHQWFAHYISKESIDDLWMIVGFSRWVAYQFMRKVYGNNEDMERLCLLDVKQPALCPVDFPETRQDLLVGYDLNPFEDSSSMRAELMNIKSPLVLYMMEQRFGKGLLQKVASKIMMTQMSGELGSGLSTILFLKLARKLSGKLEIKDFADQWIFRSGSPIFTSMYHFNRKKMVIEVRIKQRSSNEGMIGANAKFNGPITIRVQEPAGTFDTEVRLDEFEKKYDIIYHTKYKRIRRTAKKGRKNALDEDEDDEDEEEEREEANGLLGSSGQVKDDPNELLVEPDRITFEWIRIDPDSMWVCHKSFEQEDFMWNSLIRQDKDIIAHYEAVIALGKIPSPATCITLMSILKDPAYFYRVRMEAAFSLAKFDTPELEFVGLKNLTKFFEENYCMPSEKESEIIPKRNNFEDLQEYYLKCAVISAISRFRDSKGWSPSVCRAMLIDLLRFNDNTGNKFSDSNWICLLISLIGDSFLARPKNANDLSWCLSDRVHYKESREIRKEDVEEFEFSNDVELFSHRNAETVKLHFVDQDHELLELALNEVMLTLKRDRFSGSRNNGVTVAGLEFLVKWQLAGLADSNISIFLYYSRHGHYPAIRRIAIEALILITGIEDAAIAKYLAHLCVEDLDPYIRYCTALGLMNYMALVCQQIESSPHSDTRKDALAAQITTMLDVWHPISPDRYDFHVYRYLAKIVQLTQPLLPQISQLLTYIAPPLKVSGLGVAVVTSEAVVPDAPLPQIIKPLKLNFKGMKSSPAKKPAVGGQDKRSKILKKLMVTNDKLSHWFCAPIQAVIDALPGYTDIIKKPMDLGMVKEQVDDEFYANDADFAADVRLVFGNAMSFNPAATVVHGDAKKLLEIFEKDFGSKFAPRDYIPGANEESGADVANNDEYLPQPTQKVQFRKVVHTVDQLEGALKVLDKVSKSDQAAIFQYPVDREMYPDYEKIISNPIDLQAIRKKIVIKEYQTFQNFHDDMNLLISNCFTFNRQGTYGFGAGIHVQNLYHKLLKPYMKFLDPSTTQKVSPPSVNPDPARLVLPSEPLIPPKEYSKPNIGGISLRLPGKSGLTIKLPPRNEAPKVLKLAQSYILTEIPKPTPSITLRLNPHQQVIQATPVPPPEVHITPISPSTADSKPFSTGLKLKLTAPKPLVTSTAASPIPKPEPPEMEVDAADPPKIDEKKAPIKLKFKFK